MYQDYKDLLSAFHAHGVKYLIVGGYAVILHSQPRFTKDLDIFVKGDAVNSQAVYDALTTFGAPLQEIHPEDFADRSTFFRFGSDPRGIDILPEIPGVDFDSAWEHRVEQVIDPASGFRANFISADDLVASKLAAARPQDLADVEAIQKAAEARATAKELRQK